MAASRLLAADVVEVDVERAVRLQQLQRGAVAVVHRRVEAEVVGQPGHLLGGTGRSHHRARAEQPRHLPRDRPDRAGGTGDQHPVALAQPGDRRQPDVRREARHPEDAEVGGLIDADGVDAAEGGGGGQRVLAPAELVQDRVADGERVVVRGHDGADGAAVEDLPEPVRRHVGLHVVHPAPHVGVHRHHRVADQDLAGSGVGQLGLDQAEVVGGGPAGGAGGQVDLTGLRRHAAILTGRR